MVSSALGDDLDLSEGLLPLNFKFEEGFAHPRRSVAQVFPKGHFQGHLDGGGSVVGVENALCPPLAGAAEQVPGAIEDRLVSVRREDDVPVSAGRVPQLPSHLKLHGEVWPLRPPAGTAVERLRHISRNFVKGGQVISLPAVHETHSVLLNRRVLSEGVPEGPEGLLGPRTHLRHAQVVFPHQVIHQNLHVARDSFEPSVELIQVGIAVFDRGLAP
mmetsp:Transcript_4929/g.12422  ORF Transcript_4929/g.12422 Transcript_4929/m.12422 type:complete len:216 (-) Transcript_4929:88-735(-)